MARPGACSMYTLSAASSWRLCLGITLAEDSSASPLFLGVRPEVVVRDGQADGPEVGGDWMVWAGRATQSKCPNRSIRLEALAPLAGERMGASNSLSLQKKGDGRGTGVRILQAREMSIREIWGAELEIFADTAESLIEQFDLSHHRSERATARPPGGARWGKAGMDTSAGISPELAMDARTAEDSLWYPNAADLSPSQP